MAGIFQDVHFGLRLLRRSPRFTVAAILTIALGIGATTAMFSIVYQLLLAPLPYPEPDRLVVIQWRQFGTDAQQELNGMQAQFLTRQTSLLENTAVSFMSSGCNLSGGTQPEYVPAQSVTPNFFRTLQVAPLLGRDFLSEDGTSGTTAILSYPLWRSRFNADKSVIGRTIRCNGVPLTVVGVLPATFSYFEPADVWTADSLEKPKYLNDKGSNYFTLARLRSGIPFPVAQQRAKEISARFRADYPTYAWGKNDWGADPDRLQDVLRRDSRNGALLLFGAVVLMLLIGVSNISGLMVARALVRRQEVAIRAALGATQTRLFSQLIIESLILNLLGGLLGLLLAWCGLSFISVIIASRFPEIAAVRLDWVALIFCFAITVLLGVATGLLPAWHAARCHNSEWLKRVTGTPGHQRSRKALVVAEIALALVLLSGSGILLRSFARVRTAPVGFDYRHLYAASLSLGSQKYQTSASVNAFLEKALTLLNQTPGLYAAAESAVPLHRGLDLGLHFGQCETYGIQYRAVTPSFFSAMGIPLSQGRTFNAGERAPVAIVNEKLAQECLPGGGALGRPLDTRSDDDVPRTVVGVVGSTRENGLGLPETKVVYVPVWQMPDGLMKYNNSFFDWSIVTRASTAMDVDGIVRRAVQKADMEQPVISVVPVSLLAGGTVQDQAIIAAVMSAFGIAALLLSAIGLYSLLAYDVAERTHEIGIRMALGAGQFQVIAMVLRHAVGLVLGGAAIGALITALAARALNGKVAGLTGIDQTAMLAAFAVLTFFGTLAAWLPARRAAKMQPMLALRQE